ncbi:response regulator [Streptomyces sp. NPDC051569]|uniref:response regulator n=1 Tax=Streptomyces sp. NPDC051569 TaxID=3365661 RepID=UPI0037AAC091
MPDESSSGSSSPASQHATEFPVFPHPPSAETPLRVVVADDNPVVRAGLTVLLSGRDDLEVVAEASDGRQAYEESVRHRPDVILLDVRMPGVDGISALPHLVSLAPVLMMTYSRESEIVHEALRLGAGGYLVHGEFTADQLVLAVRDIKQGRAHFTHSASSALLAGLRGGGPESAGAPSGPLPEGLGTAFTAPRKPSASAHVATVHSILPPAIPMPGPQIDHVLNPQQFAVNPSQPQGNVPHSSQARQQTGAAGTPHAELSQREVEIMDLIASGMTNQQIAAACFISQKTVKNHINRIFAKLNAGSRGEAIALWNGTTRGGVAHHG